MTVPTPDAARANVSVPTGNAYDKYATTNPVERRLMDAFFATLDAVLPAEAPAAVLEVGVGEGAVVRHLRMRWPDAVFVGLDLPDPVLAGHWHGAGFHPLFGSIEALPFPTDSFDLVLAIEVLEHVARPETALGELARVARGELIASVPREPIWRLANLARGRYLRDLGNTPGHVNHWSKGGFAALVGRQFQVISVRSPLPWTMLSARSRPLS